MIGGKMKRLLVAAVLLPTFLTVAPQANAQTAGCVATKPAVPGAQVVSATAEVKPGGDVPSPFPGFPPVTEVPPYCAVTLVLTHPGANDRVNLSLWLPVSGWNGRFQGTGGGGYAMTQGDIALAVAVKDGYAVAGTDGGHVNDFEDPSTWALGPDGHVDQALLLNFASRSLHDMAVAGKAVTTSHYGKAPRYSYWTGCSTGGRQGLMEAQRFPDDYDGISANAPAVNWDRFIPDLVWPQVVMQQEHNFPTQCEFQAFHDAATAACDRNDGVADGVVDLPKSCDYNPYRLVGTKIVCDGKEITISRADADVVRKIWQGTPLWYGLNRTAPFGSLANTVTGPDGTTVGVPFGIGANWLKYFVQEDPSFDLRTITYRDFDRLFAKSRAKFNQVIGTDDPDLSAFRAAGGKMITWHGIDDSIIPYQGTVDYRQRVEHRMGGASTVDGFYRLFLTPGVDHCGFAGTGPIPADPLPALVDWVEKGRAPETLPATTMDGTRTRDICRYPLHAQYTGHGDPNSAASYTCHR
jgi:hypothetical protein